MSYLRIIFPIAVFIGIFPTLVMGQSLYPGTNWQKIQNPEAVGWSTEKLQQAKSIADSIQSDAYLIIYKGAVLDFYGNIRRKYMCHSVRKSFLSALIGIHVDRGTIDLGQTLEALNITESSTQLTQAEKSATIEDLLSSRSGIYLPAAYEFPTRKPIRGAYKPGTHWFYNNWDFNTLLTIYEQLTQEKIFEDFYSQIALPIQMEDFEMSDGYYHLEPNKSSHPAYPFRMSARDMARFGLLFLRKGMWNGKQIISPTYVQRSTSPISQTYAEGEGYGYLWWVDQRNFTYSYFSAEGYGRNSIVVVPEIDLVIVHRTNTYIGKEMSYRQRGKLIKKIFEAYVDSTENTVPLTLIPFTTPKEELSFEPVTDIDPTTYVGTYHMIPRLDFESPLIEIFMDEANQLTIYIPYKGYFAIFPISETLFMLEDSYEYVSFIMDQEGVPKQIVYHQNSREGNRE